MTIVIDPGHGGALPAGSSTPYGARSRTGALEKDLVLRLAEKLASRLGGRARLTRTDDRNLAVGERQAAGAGADAFVSLHASARVGRRGGAVWVHPDGSGASRVLASTLQNALGRVRPAPMVRQEPAMAILDPRHLPAPAALVEVDVLGSPDSESDAHLDEVAAALADGLAEWEERQGDAYGDSTRRGIQSPPPAQPHALEVDADPRDDRFREPPGAGESYGGEARYGTPWGVVRHYVAEAAGGAAAADDRDWYTDEDLRPTPGARPHDAPRPSTARQADDALSPDFRHLGAPGMSMAFSVTPTHLQALARANDFDVAGGQDEVVFGFRGARLVDAAARGRWGASVSISEDMFDHYGFHCVLGVWKRSTGQVVAFDASTVPNRRHMERQRAAGAGAQIANLLPTGRYLLSVGRHRAVPNALILPSTVVVIRSNDDLVYTTRDVFEKHAPADNIHPAFADRDAQYSSAGCQTVPGNYNRDAGTHTGDWSRFRDAAAFANRDGQRYVYMLLTGREARLCAGGAGVPRRLRFGSAGAVVNQVQDALRTAGHYRGTTDGTMGPDAVMAVVAWQRAQAGAGGAADGIVTPAMATAMGFVLR